ncbi:MAG: tetratricopeptide repeat protein [Hyphomicrobiaceae bacterium]|nr:tetratricopeptide repeat protein [Hyphomicrobiaceae bacterium]
MADTNDSLMREIKEELERERLAALWKTYGTLVIAAAILFVAGVAGVQAWRWQEKTAAEAAGARYDAALFAALSAKPEEATQPFSELAASGPAGYRMLAELHVAASHHEAGRDAEAVAAYDALAKSPTADPLFRDYAVLQAATLRAAAADFTEIENRLNDLNSDTNPWRHSARELLGLAALKAGKAERARALFGQLLSETGTPPGLRDRAEMVMAQLLASETPAAPVEPAKAVGAGTGSAGANTTGDAAGPTGPVTGTTGTGAGK